MSLKKCQHRDDRGLTIHTGDSTDFAEWIAPPKWKLALAPEGTGEISQAQAGLRAQRLVGFGIRFMPWEGVGPRTTKLLFLQCVVVSHSAHRFGDPMQHTNPSPRPGRNEIMSPGPGAALADSFAPGYSPLPLRGHPIPATALFRQEGERNKV